MKTSKSLLLLSVICCLASCHENTIMMHTEVSPDGTCRRDLSFLTDTSACMSEYVLADPVYCVAHRRELNEKQDSFLVYLSYEYPSVEQMSAHIPFHIAGHPLTATGKLEKKFRWFYTDYTFTEEYAPLPVSLPLPLTYALTEDEASYWLTGRPDIYAGYSPYEIKEELDYLEKKFWRYVSACFLCDAYAILADHYASISDAPLTYDAFVMERDSFVEQSLQTGYSAWDNEPRLFTAYFHNEAYAAALNGCLSDTLEQRKMLYLAIQSFRVDYRLSMSGNASLIDTDNGILQEDGLHFWLTGPRLLSGNYAVAATFRTANTWACVVSVCIICFALFMLFFPLIKRKRE